MSCFDVYTLAGQGCTVIQTYPSQVHPPSGRVRPSGPLVTRGVHPRSRVLPDDEEVLIALALLNL